MLLDLIQVLNQASKYLNNARSLKSLSDDQTNQEGLKTKDLVSQFALSQVIINPTHISQKFNSCIDLLFRNQQNLIIDSGV